MNKLLLLLTLMVSVIMAGCETHSTYYWANYEPLVYSSYADPEKIPSDEQIEILNQDISDSQLEGKPLPPGFYAHLGNLYYQVGDIESALKSFVTEKQLFPESTLLMDRFIERIQGDEAS